MIKHIAKMLHDQSVKVTSDHFVTGFKTSFRPSKDGASKKTQFDLVFVRGSDSAAKIRSGGASFSFLVTMDSESYGL